MTEAKETLPEVKSKQARMAKPKVETAEDKPKKMGFVFVEDRGYVYQEVENGQQTKGTEARS